MPLYVCMCIHRHAFSLHVRFVALSVQVSESHKIFNYFFLSGTLPKSAKLPTYTLNHVPSISASLFLSLKEFLKQSFSYDTLLHWFPIFYASSTPGSAWNDCVLLEMA